MDIEPDPEDPYDDFVGDSMAEYTVPELVVPPTFPAIRFDCALVPADSTSLPTRLLTPPKGFSKASSEFQCQPDDTLDSPAVARAALRPGYRSLAKALVIISAGIVCGLTAYWLRLRSFEPLMDYGTLLLMPICALTPALLAARLLQTVKCPTFVAAPLAVAVAAAGYAFAAVLVSVLLAQEAWLTPQQVSTVGFVELAQTITEPLRTLTTLSAMHAWLWCAAQFGLVVVFVFATTSRGCSLAIGCSR